MSLLNEMLHDLARQKPSKQITPLFTPAFTPNKSKSPQKILLLCLALITLICSLFLFNKHLVLKNIIITKSVPETERNTIDINNIPQPTPQTPSESAVFISYIEPLTSAASLRVGIQLPISRPDTLNDWPESQNELSVMPVNKVYTAPTIDEWHDAQLNKALQAIDKGFDAQAIALLQEILLKIPNASDVRENLALLYMSSGDFTHTAEVINEGLKYSPNDAALITVKARLFLDQGKATEAIKLLTGYRPSMTSFPDFYGTLAAALQSEGRILEAGNIYRSLLQIDPDDSRYWLGYAIALEHNHKANQAIEAYVRASQNPDSEPTVRDYAENRLKALQG